MQARALTVRVLGTRVGWKSAYAPLVACGDAHDLAIAFMPSAAHSNRIRMTYEW